MDKAVQFETAVLLDGGMGSTLQMEEGVDVDSSSLWSAVALSKQPSSIVAVHKRFIEAGSQIITAASYQASVKGFVQHLKVSANEAKVLVQKSVCLAKTAANGSDVKVAASVGPYGAVLADRSEYTGSYATGGLSEEIRAFHRERIDCLLEAKPDLWAVETIPVSEEAVFLMDYLNRVSDIPVWVSVSLKEASTGTVPSLASGDEVYPLSLEAQKLLGSQLLAFGANCSSVQTIGKCIHYLKSREVTGPLIAYPNAEYYYDQNEDKRQRAVDDLVECLNDWIANDVKYVGGCCGFGPGAIRRLKQEIDLRSKSN